MDEYGCLEVRAERAVRWVTIDAPPANVITAELFRDLRAVTAALSADPDVVVAVFESADPEFFMAHFDVEAILSVDTSDRAVASAELNSFGQLCEALRTAPMVSLCKIRGRVGGGGAEIAAAMDMRFGDPSVLLCQMEVPLGILPGGGGTQRIPALVGRGRALEIICGADDIDGQTLEAWGWLNRCLPTARLDVFVDDLARRIGSFPAEAVRQAKASVDVAAPDPVPGLLVESDNFAGLLRTADAGPAMRRFLDHGGQTRDGERDLQATIDAATAAKP